MGTNSSEPHVMTIEQVNELIPEVARLVERQLRIAEQIEERLGRLRARSGAKPSREGTVDLSFDPADDDDVRSLKYELQERVSAYREGWQRVQELGAVVKDPRIGLLDFYGRIAGKLVWLCWRYGEDAVRYYHDLDAGFPGRKAIGAEVQKNLLN